MVDKLWLDFETRSTVDLEDRGLDNYVSSGSTQVLLCAFAFDDKAVRLWQPHLAPMPTDLEDALHSPWVTVYSWNAQFEHQIINRVLKIPKPIQEFRDPMVNARYLSLPGKLADAGEILGLKDSAKMAEDGDRLIRLFCEPETEGGQTTLFGVSEPTFRDWSTDPEEWELFCRYCRQDVVAERAALKKMRNFPVPESEWDLWCLDQKINEAGWPVDQLLVDGAKHIVMRALEPLVQELKDLSGVANPNSREQLLAWLRTQGYTFSSLEKAFTKRAMDGECPLTPAAKRVLEIRGQTAKSSVSKYTAVSDLVGPESRLRHQYTFYGARTGRWTAQGVNVANLPRPVKAVEKKLNLAVDLVRKTDYDGVVREFGKPLDVATSVIRSAFRAPKGKKFVVADLNAIENRGLGYLARCDSILKVFRDKLDPYLSFAVKLYGSSYEDLWNEWKVKGDSTKRNNAKPAVLGAGYQLSPGDEFTDEDGNLQWSGLMGYARALGVELTREECAYAIDVFRKEYWEVKRLWKDMERAAAFAIRHPGQLVGVGCPHTDRDRAYFEEKGRPILDPIINFKATGSRILEMVLPSGRSLFYVDPEVQNIEKEWEGRKYTVDAVSHMGRDQKTKQWVRVDAFGGRWVENADQAVSRDVLAHGMKLADQMGFEIVGGTYDEIITLTDANGSLGVEELCACMTQAPPWCGDAFPLGAEGFEDDIYRKG